MIKEAGADGVQVATRFAVTKESGLPDEVKQKYFDAQAEDIVVNAVSPTGYLMRMLRQSPAINANLKPQCEPYGYMLSHGRCAYLEAWQQACSEGRLEEGVPEKTCLCAQMRNCKVWTLGAMAWCLKETSHKDAGYCPRRPKCLMTTATACVTKCADARPATDATSVGQRTFSSVRKRLPSSVSAIPTLWMRAQISVTHSTTSGRGSLPVLGQKT